VSLLFSLSSFGQTQDPATVEPASYEALADLLENDQSRTELIDQLRAMAAQTNDDPESKPNSQQVSDATSVESSRQENLSLSGRLATGLQAFSVRLSEDLSNTGAAIRDLIRGDSPFGVIGGRWQPALKVLMITIGALLLSYFVLRMIAGFGFSRLNKWVRQPPQPPETIPSATQRLSRSFGQLTFSRKLLGVLAAILIDLTAILFAALAAYVTASAIAEQTGDMTFALELIVAFIMIEAVKVVVRGAFSTRYDQLRLLPLQPTTARFWNRWMGVLISLTGYCLLVVVPITQVVLLSSVSRLLGLVIMFGVYVYALKVIWSRRKIVRTGLIEWAEKSSTTLFGTLIRVLARSWHLLATAYFTILLVVSQTDQQQALAFMLRATLQSVIAVVVGALLAAALSALLTRRIALPDAWRSALPLLEERVNAYVPAMLKGLRLLILIMVALVVLDAWHFFDLGSWLSSPSGHAVVAMVFHVALILAIAALSWTVVASVIEHRLGTSDGSSRATEREKTLLMLFRSSAAVVISTMTTLMLLSHIGINIGPLIAGAGVAGLAIGFGAQKLVQDVITGAFIQLENGMHQNDIVELSGLFGTVEKITIRSVVIRTLDGGYHLIPFSTIDKLTNHTRDYGYHYAEYNVAYRADVDEAIAQLELAFKDLMENPELASEVLEDISIPGVTALNEHGFRVRVLIKTTPGNQWAIQRGYNRLVKKRFDAAGIELPYPQTVVHFGNDSRGQPGPGQEPGPVDLLQSGATGRVSSTRPKGE
jgi:small-conductance mechanosensitive channel